jgi:hypothetical protein
MTSLLNALEHAFSHHARYMPDQERFFNAIQKENVETMEAVIGRHPREFMTWETKDGGPLQTAQAWGCFSSFATLLGMDRRLVDTDYGQGWTPLLTSLKGRQNMFTEYILQHHPEIDTVATDEKTGRKVTALQLAIDGRNAEALKWLLERGANTSLAIETKDGRNLSPLDYVNDSKKTRWAAALIEQAPKLQAEFEHTWGPYHPPKPAPVQQQPAPPPAAPMQEAKPSAPSEPFVIRPGSALALAMQEPEPPFTAFNRHANSPRNHERALSAANQQRVHRAALSYAQHHNARNHKH